MIVLPILFFTAVLVQIFFLLFVFVRFIKHKNEEESTYTPPVTIIIAAADELHNLKELLPLLDKQDYPEFEILVADDRSNDGTYDYLLFNQDKLKNINFLRIKDLPDHFTAKKYAVTMAVKKSKYNTLLFTDADCRPESDQWIRSMVAQMTEKKEIVLGFSSYKRYPKFLNAFIRYETFQTALQYFSFAVNGQPFMGVGRNLMYEKSVFWRNNGFSSHHSLLSGDDDLFVNQAANKSNVAISILPRSFTVSEPKHTWSEWFNQKRRHLSVGKRYKFRDRINLALLWLSGMFIWLMFLPVFFIEATWFQAPDWSMISPEFLKQNGINPLYGFTNYMRLMLGVLLFWLFLRWIVLAKANEKLGRPVTSWKILYYDFAFVLYLFVFGIITLFSSPERVRKW
ncbi:MAG: glycosyltransferase [Leadbetterella sp.]